MRAYHGYIKDDKSFNILFENSMMVIGHIYESSYCFNKITKEEFAIFEFDFDPVCGIVGKDNEWCLIGGDVLILKTWIDNTIRFVGDLKNIFDIKEIEENEVQILTDPWSGESAIWHLTINLRKLTNPIVLQKIRDFKDYENEPYSENIKW